MDLPTALSFARDHRHGVLTTQMRNGRPQLSNITYVLDDTGEFRVSITATRAKYKNLVRDSRTSLHVTRDDFFAYAVFEGDAVLSPVAADPHDATVEALVEHYRAVYGGHPDWDEYRAAMVRDQRLLLRLRPTRAYGMVPR